MQDLHKEKIKIKQQFLQEFYEDKFLNNKINEKYSSPHLISLEAKNIGQNSTLGLKATKKFKISLN